ncbi:MAG: NnrU family protein [Erythrobacter sp.]
MDQSVVILIAACAAFVGSHFAMSHPARRAIVKAFGKKGFEVFYSAVSIIMLAWIYFAFKAAPPKDLPGSGDVGWAIATALTLPAMILFAGSFPGNPAIVTLKSEENARAEPQGVFKVTRHPMMWGFALWAMSHMVLLWSMRTMVTAFAMGLLALVGAHMQDRKKEMLMGEAWVSWSSKTVFWPRWGAIFGAGTLPWAVGLILFVFLSWLHGPLGGIAAGIWRWF